MADDDGERPARALRALREKAGMTRNRLAETAGVSVAAVRRLEVGRVVPIDEASRVVSALGETPEAIFPRALEVIRRWGGESKEKLMDLAWNERDFRQELDKEGIDVHPAVWMLKVHFRGGDGKETAVFCRCLLEWSLDVESD